MISLKKKIQEHDNSNTFLLVKAKKQTKNGLTGAQEEKKKQDLFA